ncbi:MAG: queuosine precursor transporter [Burkholderiales bacterium]
MVRLVPFVCFSAAMIAVILSSNILVQYPINDWLTWGAIIYPFAFLTSDIANRYYGFKVARQLIYVGFVAAIVLSAIFATPRIAIASGTAFLCAELVDAWIFDRLRRRSWWKPPLYSTLAGSALDTTIFFALAFYGTGVPWITLGLGDFAVKLAMALLTLLPFRMALLLVRPTA